MAISAGALVVLVLSGAWLTRWYRAGTAFWDGGRPPSAVQVVLALHRLGAGVLLLAAGLLVGLRLATGAWRALPALLVTVAGVGLVATGRRLAWVELGLRAVKVNLDAAGMLFAAFDPLVRFVIVAGVGEMAQTTFRAILVVHAVALPVVVAALLWVQRRRDRPTAPGT